MKPVNYSGGVINQSSTAANALVCVALLQQERMSDLPGAIRPSSPYLIGIAYKKVPIDSTALEVNWEEFAEFRWKRRVFRLKEPVLCHRSCSDGLWIFKNDELNIHVYSKSLKDARQMVHEDFYANWVEIVEENNENLTQRAITLKMKLREIVK